MATDAPIPSGSRDAATTSVTALQAEFTQMFATLPGLVKMLRADYPSLGVEETEDAVQDAFEALLLSTRPIDYPFRWVMQVATRKVFRARRNTRLEFDHHVRNLEISERVIPEPAVHGEYLRREELAELKKSFERLDVPHGELLLMHVDGMSIDDIAKQTGLPVRVVATRLGRARQAYHHNRFKAESARLAAAPNATSRPPGGASHRALELVEKLPDRQRTVLDLAVEGLPPRRIAERLGVDANTVRVNLHHAKKKIAVGLGVTSKEVVPHLLRIGVTAAALAATA